MASQAPKMDNVSKLMLILSLLAILAVVYVLVTSLINTYKKNSLKGEVDNTQLVLNAENNIKPIGIVAEAGAVVANAAGRPPKEIYDAVCTSCHATGVLDAPKLGDTAAWEARAGNGLAGLLKTAAEGKGSMPAKGGDPSITDSELEAVVLYMTKESGLDLGGAEKPSAEEAPAEEAPKTNEKAEAKVEVEVEVEEKKEVAKVEVAPAKETAPAAPTTPEAPVATAEGKKVYDVACFACHATGVAGSPKLGDKALWAPRIAQGMDALYETALKGKGAMPPKGGNMSLEDSAVKAAVDYMISQSQ